jgi:penicillin-binding protein 1C
VKGWFIPGISPITACEIHREVLVDAQSGLRVASDDGSRQLRREVYEFWPSDLLALFEKAGVPRRPPPPFLPGAESALESIARSGKPPQIVSPTPGQAYALPAESTWSCVRSPMRTPGRSTGSPTGNSFGSTAAGQSLPWSAPPGAYRLTALDDHGRAGVGKVAIEAQPSR